MDDSDTHVLGAKPCHALQPSFKRWLKHSFSLKRTQQFISAQDELAITQAVQLAEAQHHAEIRVVIEAHLPSLLAYKHNTRARAQQLFATLGVWDTEQNTGILLYINLCERKIELLADRGIHTQVDALYWQSLCDEMAQTFKQLAYRQGILNAISQLSALLKQKMPYVAANNNEISNQPILLD